MSKFSSSFVLNASAQSLKILNADIESQISIFAELLTMHESVALDRCRDIVVRLNEALIKIQQKDIVMIGRNNDGKTFLLNLMMFNSCINSRMYKREDFASARQEMLSAQMQSGVLENFLGNAANKVQSQALLSEFDGPICIVARQSDTQASGTNISKGLEALQNEKGPLGVICRAHESADEIVASDELRSHKSILDQLKGMINCEAKSDTAYLLFVLNRRILREARKHQYACPLTKFHSSKPRCAEVDNEFQHDDFVWSYISYVYGIFF